MDAGVFFLAVFGGSLAAGFVGALTGLGGGAILTPLLVLCMGVDLRYAIGASLVAVIGSSCGAAAGFVRHGFANVRVAMVLEVATVTGALLGAYIAGLVDRAHIAVVFSLVLFWSAYSTVRPVQQVADDGSADPLSTRLRLDSAYPGVDGPIPYRVHRVPAGLVVMFGAGALSALAGVGSGVVKVLAMDRLMRLPFRVSTTTSNFMIGVTAAASVGVYLHRGQIEPRICAPVVLGSLAGSMAGARLLPYVKTRWLRVGFAAIVSLAGVELIRRALTGGL